MVYGLGFRVQSGCICASVNIGLALEPPRVEIGVYLVVWCSLKNIPSKLGIGQNAFPRKDPCLSTAPGNIGCSSYMDYVPF